MNKIALCVFSIVVASAGSTENTNVIHQLLREGDPRFRVELLNFSQRDQILQLSNIKDGKILFPPKIRNIAKQIKLDG